MGPLATARTVVVMDHRGHGHGLPVSGDYEIEDLADDAVAVLGALGITEVIVVGFSLGSVTALDMAARYPERVAGLVLTAGCLVLRPRAPERLLLVAVTQVLALAARLGLARSLGSRYFGLTRRAAGPAFQEAWPWIRQELQSQDPRGVAPALRAALRHDARRHVDRLRQTRTVVVVHERDVVIPAALQWQMARELEAETFTVDADHEAPLSHPDEYLASVLAAVARIELGESRSQREATS
jgi:3-oxoadipate enol-lactonase